MTVCVITVVVTMTSAISVVLVVIKVPVCLAAIINMVVVLEVLGVDVRALIDVGFIVVAAIVIVLKFPLVVPYFVGVSSGLFMDALAGAILRCLSGIGIEVFADVNANTFDVMTTLAFPA